MHESTAFHSLSSPPFVLDARFPHGTWLKSYSAASVVVSRKADHENCLLPSQVLEICLSGVNLFCVQLCTPLRPECIEAKCFERSG